MRPPPDAQWLDFLKVAYMYLWLLIMAALAAAVGLGHVSADTSFGLGILLGALANQGTPIAGWAFSGRSDTKPDA